jgi:hypothetical protein
VRGEHEEDVGLGHVDVSVEVEICDKYWCLDGGGDECVRLKLSWMHHVCMLMYLSMVWNDVMWGKEKPH